MTGSLSRKRGANTVAPSPKITGASNLPTNLSYLGRKVTLEVGPFKNDATSGGPSRPNFESQGQNSASVSTKLMGGISSFFLARNVNQAVDQLSPSAKFVRGMDAQKLNENSLSIESGMRDQKGFENAVRGMFGNEAGDKIASRVLERIKPLEDETAPNRYLSPLVVATALRSMGPVAIEKVDALLPEIGGAVPSPSSELFGLERILATTAPGTDAIKSMRGLGPEQIEPYRDCLLICGALERKGVNIGKFKSIDDVVKKIVENPKLRIDKPIGSADDVPLQLLSQALMHLHGREQGAAQDNNHKAAFVAWKKGSFLESGPKTDFNNAIERLHKFSEYVDRADHGPRTLANIGRDVLALAGRLIGKGKSPLTQTRRGTLGGDLGLLHEESDKFKQGLSNTLNVAAGHFKKELSLKLSIKQSNPDDVHKSLAQAAVLDLCKDKVYRSNFTMADVVESARKLLPDKQFHLDEKKLSNHLNPFVKSASLIPGNPYNVYQLSLSRLAIQLGKEEKNLAPSLQAVTGIVTKQITPRNDGPSWASEPRIVAGPPLDQIPPPNDGPSWASEPRIVAGPPLNQITSRNDGSGLGSDIAKVSDHQIIHALETSQSESSNEQQQKKPTTLQETSIQEIAKLVADLREIKNGGPPGRPLFKLSDVNPTNSNTPREGPNADYAQEVMLKLSTAKYTNFASFSDGSVAGLGTTGAFTLAAAATGTPLVYPILNLDKGKRAVISVGLASTGGKFFIGTEESTSGSVGGGGVLLAPTMPVLTLGALTDLSYKGSNVRSKGVVITTRNDQEGWKEKLPQVVDYLFEQSRLPQTGVTNATATRAKNASETWSRFAEKFGNDPNIAIGWNKDTSSEHSVGLELGGLMRFTPAIGSPGIGPNISAKVSAETNSFLSLPSATGADVQTSRSSSRISARIGAGGWRQSFPGVTTQNSQVTGWGASTPLLIGSMEINITGSSGEMRIGRTRDGRLSAGVCHKEFTFKSPESLIKFVNTRKAGWVDAMVTQDPTENTTKEMATQRLDTFLKQVKDTPVGGDRVYGEQMVLHKTAAEKINDYEAHRTTILGLGDGQNSKRQLSASETKSVEAIDKEVSRILVDDKNWQHDGLFAFQINKVGSNAGINLGLKVVNEESASAVRLTALLLPSNPEL